MNKAEASIRLLDYVLTYFPLLSINILLVLPPELWLRHKFEILFSPALICLQDWHHHTTDTSTLISDILTNRFFMCYSAILLLCNYITLCNSGAKSMYAGTPATLWKGNLVRNLLHSMSDTSCVYLSNKLKMIRFLILRLHKTQVSKLYLNMKNIIS